MQIQQRRIPQGPVLATIPLEAAKAYPTHLFQNTQEIRFAYADKNNGENIELQIKVSPDGAKTAPHPQLICFIRGDYHVERWLNYGGKTDPFKWTTWLEFHMNADQILMLAKALLDAKVWLEAQKQ